MDARTEKCKRKYEGVERFCRDGFHKFIIEEFRAANDITIRYPNGYSQVKSIDQINKGIIYPWKTNPDRTREPVFFEDVYKKYIGSIFQTNEGFFVEVIDYKGTADITIRFTSEPYHTMKVTSQNLRKGQIHNPYMRNMFGGYEGVGPYKTNEYEWLYRRWYNIGLRAVKTDYYVAHHGGNTSAYDECILDERWLNYSAFAEWYLQQVSMLNKEFDYEVDKDLLYRFYRRHTNDMKVYSPETCVLIPHELNNKLQLSNVKKADVIGYQTNINKASKEIKECAQKYYDLGAITDQVYGVIMYG